ncbi:MAG TPA: hypothetical protein ENI23_15295, partial [bacterium]|nr:hypothetical protein [bacterium]
METLGVTLEKGEVLAQHADLWHKFLTLSLIPRESGNESQALEMLASFALEHGYEAKHDRAGNLLVQRPGVSNTLFQGHVDVFPLGDQSAISPIVLDDGLLVAEDSVLGADNGGGVAIMMQLMKDGASADFLFTVEEETGLSGVKQLGHDLSQYELSLIHI